MLRPLLAGANGLASPRDFLTPVAWTEAESREPYTLIHKLGGVLFQVGPVQSCTFTEPLSDQSDKHKTAMTVQLLCCAA